jgi:hypothetical protein
MRHQGVTLNHGAACMESKNTLLVAAGGNCEERGDGSEACYCADAPAIAVARRIRSAGMVGRAGGEQFLGGARLVEVDDAAVDEQSRGFEVVERPGCGPVVPAGEFMGQLCDGAVVSLAGHCVYVSEDYGTVLHAHGMIASQPMSPRMPLRPHFLRKPALTLKNELIY